MTALLLLPAIDTAPADLVDSEAASAARWWAAAAAGGFAWPPTEPRSRLLPPAGNLLHQVGFHFFHDVDRDGDGVLSLDQYTDTVRLGRDFRRLEDVVIRPLAALGFQLSPTLGALSFPAYDPTTVDGGGNHGTAFYFRASEELQAAMHLRIAATALACGAELAGVFTFIRGPQESAGSWPNWEPEAWIDFSSAGVRNDLFNPHATFPATTYTQGTSAWPRSSWHALGRLTWLLSQAGPGRGALRGLRVAYNERGCTVLCFEFPSPSAAGPGGAPLSRAWARAYLAWVDQYASDPDLHPDPRDWPSNPTQLVFQDPTRHKYELLPVVPRAAGPGSATGADPNGWATNPGSPAWRWTGWDGCVQSSVSSSGHFALTLLPCDPRNTFALAPACILTDATLLGVT